MYDLRPKMAANLELTEELMASTDHIPGENQSLETYKEVLTARTEAFIQYMKAEWPQLTHMDECDWDDQYESWLDVDRAL